MYKAYIEPDLKAAHLQIHNKFNPFSGFMNPTYILKSPKRIPAEEIKKVLKVEKPWSNPHHPHLSQTTDEPLPMLVVRTSQCEYSNRVLHGVVKRRAAQDSGWLPPLIQDDLVGFFNLVQVSSPLMASCNIVLLAVCLPCCRRADEVCRVQ